MDLNELLKDVTSFSKEAAMKENMRMLSLKDSVTAEAFKHAQLKLASYFGNIKIDSPESNLTEFSRNSLSGNMKAVLSVSTTAGLKRLPIHFTVKASVPTLVETPEQIVASLENVKGSIDKEVEIVLEAQNKRLQISEEEVEIDNKIQSALDNGMETKAAYDELMFGIKKEAKKKEVELVSVENTSASQFPVKVLKYPKMYLPELKKGDIINVGGLKYKYTGDDKTISGEPGLNVYLELVCNTKTASLNKVAEDAEDLNEVEKEINTRLNDIKNLDGDDIKYLVSVAEDYLKDSEVKSHRDTYNYLLNTVAEDRDFSMWYLTRDGIKLKDLPSQREEILNNVKTVNDVDYILGFYKEDINKLKDFNSLPGFIKNIIKDNTDYLVKLIDKHPNLINKELADKIIEEKPEDLDVLLSNHPKEFKEFFEGMGDDIGEPLSNDEGDDDNIDGFFDEDVEEEPTNTELNDIDNENNNVETSKSETPIEKEAELDTLSFKANVSKLDIEWLDGRDESIKNKLKEIDTRLANIPNDWIEIMDTTWYGDIEWKVSMDAKEDGLSSISFKGEPSEVECNVTVEYFENAKAADSENYSKLTIKVMIDLKEVGVKFNDESSNQYNNIFAKSLNIYEDNKAILFL